MLGQGSEDIFRIWVMGMTTLNSWMHRTFRCRFKCAQTQISGRGCFKLLCWCCCPWIFSISKNWLADTSFAGVWAMQHLSIPTCRHMLWSERWKTRRLGPFILWFIKNVSGWLKMLWSSKEQVSHDNSSSISVIIYSSPCHSKSFFHGTQRIFYTQLQLNGQWCYQTSKRLHFLSSTKKQKEKILLMGYIRCLKSQDNFLSEQTKFYIIQQYAITWWARFKSNSRTRSFWFMNQLFISTYSLKRSNSK